MDSKVIGGVVLGLLLGAGGFYAVERHVLGPPADCGGRCGEGTVCTNDRCEVVVAEVEPEVEPEADDGKTKRKGKRGRRTKAGAGASATGPAVDDDSAVPGFDPNGDQTIGMADGTGRLSDAQVDRELAKLDKAFQACVRDANERVAELGRGTVKLSFGVAGTGKVTGVNVSAASNLEAAGIAPCVRKAVYGHKFPAFDGPEMKVSSSFSVD